MGSVTTDATDYVIYVHIEVYLDRRGGFAAARHSIVRKESDGALA